MLLASSLPIWAEANHTLIATNTITNSTTMQISTCSTVRRNRDGLLTMRCNTQEKVLPKTTRKAYAVSRDQRWPIVLCRVSCYIALCRSIGSSICK
eukprot:1155996-Pelagomonas_calceolata.AAC.4